MLGKIIHKSASISAAIDMACDGDYSGYRGGSICVHFNFEKFKHIKQELF